MPQVQWTEQQINDFLRKYEDPECSDEGACRLLLEEVPEGSRAAVLSRVSTALHEMRARLSRGSANLTDQSGSEAMDELELKLDWARGVLGVRPD